MKLLVPLLLLSLALSMPAHASGDGILLATGGGPGTTQFFVHFNSAGLLTVERREMLKKPKYTDLQLSKKHARALIRLAASSDDFSLGCDKVSDGTNAEMKVVRAGVASLYSCRGADKWPVGSRTKAFIDAVNAPLPAAFHVF
jgi:hypothetical protein